MQRTIIRMKQDIIHGGGDGGGGVMLLFIVVTVAVVMFVIVAARGSFALDGAIRTDVMGTSTAKVLFSTLWDSIVGPVLLKAPSAVDAGCSMVRYLRLIHESTN